MRKAIVQLATVAAMAAIGSVPNELDRVGDVHIGSMLNAKQKAKRRNKNAQQKQSRKQNRNK